MEMQRTILDPTSNARVGVHVCVCVCGGGGGSVPIPLCNAGGVFSTFVMERYKGGRVGLKYCILLLGYY